MRHPMLACPTAWTVVDRRRPALSLHGRGRAGRCALLMACALLGACHAKGDTLPDAADSASPTPAVAIPEPALVTRLPERLDSFAYAGYRHFEDGSGGYSFRYRNPAKKRLADVYVYPVAEQNAELDHRTLVMGSTRATLRAIDEAVSQGVYANFRVVDSATRSSGRRMVSRVQATYLRENLASYTMLYQSEHEGTLMKIRLSMPDNERNRASTEWDAFAEHMFRLVIDDLIARAGSPSDRVADPEADAGGPVRDPAHATRMPPAPARSAPDIRLGDV